MKDVDIKRLASFPEQNPNPVMEVDLEREIFTYKNPATKTLTVHIKDEDLLQTLLSKIKERKDRGDFSCENLIGKNIYEQKVFFIEASDLARIYLNDLTERKKNEEKLRNLSLFPIHNPNPVLEGDLSSNKLTYKNPAAENLTKLVQESLLTSILLNEARNENSKKDFQREIIIEAKHYEIKVFFIDGSELVRFYLNDLTERKKNEWNLARMATFPEQNPNPIIEFDLQENVTYTNDAFKIHFSELGEINYDHPILDRAKEKLKDIVSGNMNAESFQEVKVNKKYYQQRIKFMRDMGLVRVFNSDITHQKETEELIKEKNKDITDSINYAKRIQRSILPNDVELKKMLDDHFVLFQPKDIVSGDFYWASTTTAENGERYKLIAAADCTGHGVPGALMSIICATLLNQTLKNPDVNSPAEALDYLNKELPKNLRAHDPTEEIRDGMDISMVAISESKMKMTYAGANNSIYMIRRGELTEYDPDKQPVSGSATEFKEPFTNKAIDLEKGDIIYLFTDGYADQFGGPKARLTETGKAVSFGQGKKFKYKQLQEKLLEVSPLSMDEQKAALQKIYEDWKGDLEQVDDVCVIGIRI
jgi:serine phosphatase RsbU (regulator of sigma subunit)/PAS domain-containing protein